MLKRLSIRWRLTAWYGAVLATVIALFGVSVYILMRHALMARLDAALEQDLAELENEAMESSGPDRLGQRFAKDFAHHEGYEVQVSRQNGAIAFRSDRLRMRPLPIPRIPPSLKHLDYESASLGTATADLGDLGRWRDASRITYRPDGPLILQVAAPLALIDHELAELLAVLLLTGPLALGFALGSGYLLARQALIPVDRMAAAADQITATKLDRRLEAANSDDELGRLARTLNGMIARLERSFEEIRRFTADAAHELRTPLTVMRNEAEVALRAPREPEQYRRVLENQLEEIERLARMAEQLLFLCRGDTGLMPVARNVVMLHELVHDVTDAVRVVAEQKQVTLSVKSMPPCRVRGDGDQLRRLFFNLIDNAIKFTPAGGSVVVEGNQIDGQARILVSDTGIGIAPEDLPHVFERFYRVDPARGRERDGTGLGLAIARSIVEAHGGEISIESTTHRGTRVTLSLPAMD